MKMETLPLCLLLLVTLRSTKTAIVSKINVGITDASTGTTMFGRFLHEPP